MSLLDYHDRGVHQCANRDGDAAERHDVSRDPRHSEGNEGRRTATGIVITGIMELGRCQRKISTISETVSSTSISVDFRLSIERRIRSERSQMGTTFTPATQAGFNLLDAAAELPPSAFDVSRRTFASPRTAAWLTQGGTSLLHSQGSPGASGATSVFI